MLAESHQRRSDALERLEGTERFRGIDGLLVWLDSLTSALRADDKLERIAFLGERAVADFEAALEATLIGYGGVAFDAMRDVLEIDFQLRDFAVDPQLIAVWLDADDTTLRGHFQPVHVRKRLQMAGAVTLGNNAMSWDYKAHSQLLHLRPNNEPLNFLPGRGRCQNTVFERDLGLWEIIQHGRSLRGAFQSLTAAVSPGSPADSEARKPIPEFADALHYVHAASQHFLAWAGALKALEHKRPDYAFIVIIDALLEAQLLDKRVLQSGNQRELRDELTRIADQPDSRANTLAPIALALLELLYPPSDAPRTEAPPAPPAAAS